MLNELFNPETVAVIGASRTPGKVGHEVLANLKRGGFKGTIVPVTLSGGEILGVPCYRSLREAGHKVDLSVIAVPVPAVRAAIQDSIAAGAKAVIVITAGFGESGAEGKKMEEEMAGMCRTRGVRLLGPNCIGVFNAHSHLNATFAPATPPMGGISMISQSGALCVALLDWAAGLDLGFGKVVSMGNKADLTETDLLLALAKDEKTKVIAGYLESAKGGRLFLEAAEEAAMAKPIVLLKSGVTAVGARAASSHTGSLAGADAAYGAAFKHAGIIRAETLEALFDYACAFATQPLPKGNRLTVLTNAGGAGILAADTAELNGLTLAEPSPAARQKLEKLLPPNAAFNNPVDVIGDADPDRFTAAFRVVEEDDNTDGILVLVTPQNMTKPLELAQKLAAAQSGKKPLLTAFIGGKEVASALKELSASGIPNYPTPERAVMAYEAMWRYASWRRRPTRVVVRFPVNRRRVERVMRWQKRMESPQVSEVEAKEILQAYGFRVLSGGLASDAEEAVDLARRVGFPVVMKIVSPDVIHKSDYGGVQLNLADADQVRDAYDVIMARVTRRGVGARVRGVYMEQMGRRGREVILGMTRDPQFGPMLMFGLGGIFVEVMKDVSFNLPPVTAAEARQMLASTRSFALLTGVRGQKAVELEPVVEAIQRLSQLVSDYPQIQELDINPFIVTETGAEAYVADARMSLAFQEGEEEV